MVKGEEAIEASTSLMPANKNNMTVENLSLREHTKNSNIIII